MYTLLGVDAFKIEFEKKQVVIETSLSSVRVQELIEETGRKAVLLGMGSSRGLFLNDLYGCSYVIVTCQKPSRIVTRPDLY